MAPPVRFDPGTPGPGSRLHVDYVTDPPAAVGEAIAFALGVLSEPPNFLLVSAGTVSVVGFLIWVFVRRPRVPDLVVLAETLEGYRAYVPWMVRLSLGLPLVGAGFSGYLFSPAVGIEARLLQVGLGFLLLFGLGTRAVAGIGLVTYLGILWFEPALLLAVEYVPGFVALLFLGSGEPSADHLLARVATADGTLFGRIDPGGRFAAWFGARDPEGRGVPAILRVGLGTSFVYLGFTQKLATPARALAVVEKYDLTAFVPVDPGLWVLGAGLVEIGVGTLLIVGYLTRGTAAVAFLMLTLTLFGLPDDPVLAHVTLFGLLSAVITLGAGRPSVDARLRSADWQGREGPTGPLDRTRRS